MNTDNLPCRGFITLTELQERLNLDKRQNVREQTIGRGAPYIVIGREVVFSMAAFCQWIEVNQQTGPIRKHQQAS